MQIDEWDDVSFTMKASERKGMRLFKRRTTGELRLCDESGPVETVKPKPARKSRRKDSEGDK